MTKMLRQPGDLRSVFQTFDRNSDGRVSAQARMPIHVSVHVSMHTPTRMSIHVPRLRWQLSCERARWTCRNTCSARQSRAQVYATMAGVRELLSQGHNYIGHNYIGHNYIGHNYMAITIRQDFINCCREVAPASGRPRGRSAGQRTDADASRRARFFFKCLAARRQRSRGTIKIGTGRRHAPKDGHARARMGEGGPRASAQKSKRAHGLRS